MSELWKCHICGKEIKGNPAFRANGTCYCMDCMLGTDDHPQYYGGKDDPMEAIKIIQHYDLNFCRGNVVKYILRAGKKEGEDIITDLKKARTYIDFEIERITKAETNAPKGGPEEEQLDEDIEAVACAICGFKGLLVLGKEDDGRRYVKCPNCRTSTQRAMNAEDAILNWNEAMSGSIMRYKGCGDDE